MRSVDWSGSRKASQKKLAIRNAKRLEVVAHPLQCDAKLQGVEPARLKQIVISLDGCVMVQVRSGPSQSAVERRQAGYGNARRGTARSGTQRSVGSFRNESADAIVISRNCPAHTETQHVHRSRAENVILFKNRH